jgi:hypothetical protein
MTNKDNIWKAEIDPDEVDDPVLVDGDYLDDCNQQLC